jgi:hypothetical protein
MSKKLYVGNLSFSSSEDDVRDHFAPYGEVISVNLITDRETGRLRGFGFVEMDDEGANAAIQALDGKELGGRTLKVNEAQDKPRSGGGGGRRGGGGGYGGGGGRWSNLYRRRPQAPVLACLRAGATLGIRDRTVAVSLSVKGRDACLGLFCSFSAAYRSSGDAGRYFVRSRPIEAVCGPCAPGGPATAPGTRARPGRKTDVCPVSRTRPAFGERRPGRSLRLADGNPQPLRPGKRASRWRLPALRPTPVRFPRAARPPCHPTLTSLFN